MKATTFKWVSANANNSILLKPRSFNNAQVILPISNQPYQPNVMANDSGEFINAPGYRTIGFTLVNKDSLAGAVNCTITGTGLTLNGSNYITAPDQITETVILSSTNAYVETTKYFDKVTSLSFDGGIPHPTTVQVGLGKKGVILNFFDTDSTSPMHYSLQVYPLTGTTNFTYRYFVSLIKPYQIISQYYATNSPFPDPICGFPAMAIQNNVPFIGSSTNFVGVDNASAYGLVSPATMGWLTIDDGGDGNGQLYYSLLEQGMGN